MIDNILGWLWTVSWQTAILAAVVWIITRFARKAPASWRYALWLIVVIKFFIPPLAYMPAQLAFWAKPGITMVQKSNPVEPYSPSYQDYESEYRTLTSFQANEKYAGANVLLVYTWFIIACTIGLSLASGIYMQRRFLSRSVAADSSLHAILINCMSSIGLRRIPRLRTSELCTTPILIGSFSYTIVLPAGIYESCSECDIRAMLLHELAHIKRYDILSLWLFKLVQLFFYFHPALWLAGKELARERELACDELVLRVSGISRKEYASGYVSALSMASDQSHPPAALAMAEPFEVEKQRVERILQGPLSKLTPVMIVVLAVAVIIGAPTYIGYIGKMPLAGRYRQSYSGPAIEYSYPPTWRSGLVTMSLLEAECTHKESIALRIKIQDRSWASRYWYRIEPERPGLGVRKPSTTLIADLDRMYSREISNSGTQFPGTRVSELCFPMPLKPVKHKCVLRGILLKMPQEAKFNYGPFDLETASKPHELVKGELTVAVAGWGIGDSASYYNDGMFTYSDNSAKEYFKSSDAATDDSGYLNLALRVVEPNETYCRLKIESAAVYDANGHKASLKQLFGKGLGSPESEGRYYYGFIIRRIGPDLSYFTDSKVGEMKILAVDPHGPAWKAGLRVGDVIVRFPGSEIKVFEDLYDVARKSSLTMTILRNGKIVNLTIKPEVSGYIRRDPGSPIPSWKLLVAKTKHYNIPRIYSTSVLSSRTRVPKNFKPCRVVLYMTMQPLPVERIPFVIRDISLPKELWSDSKRTY